MDEGTLRGFQDVLNQMLSVEKRTRISIVLAKSKIQNLQQQPPSPPPALLLSSTGPCCGGWLLGDQNAFYCSEGSLYDNLH